jgi:hypothetical protein
MKERLEELSNIGKPLNWSMIVSTRKKELNLGTISTVVIFVYTGHLCTHYDLEKLILGVNLIPIFDSHSNIDMVTFEVFEDEELNKPTLDKVESYLSNFLYSLHKLNVITEQSRMAFWYKLNGVIYTVVSNHNVPNCMSSRFNQFEYSLAFATSIEGWISHITDGRPIDLHLSSSSVVLGYMKSRLSNVEEMLYDEYLNLYSSFHDHPYIAEDEELDEEDDENDLFEHDSNALSDSVDNWPEWDSGELVGVVEDTTSSTIIPPLIASSVLSVSNDNILSQKDKIVNYVAIPFFENGITPTYLSPNECEIEQMLALSELSNCSIIDTLTEFEINVNVDTTITFSIVVQGVDDELIDEFSNYQSVYLSNGDEIEILTPTELPPEMLTKVACAFERVDSRVPVDRKYDSRITNFTQECDTETPQQVSEEERIRAKILQLESKNRR